MSENTPVTAEAPASEAPETNPTSTEVPSSAAPTTVSSEGTKADKEAEALASAAAKRKYKIKVDNEELEVDEDELVRDYQLKKASYKKMSEAAKLRKQAEEVISLLKTDPRKALRHPAINADMRKLAEEIIQETLEEEMLSEEQKEIRRLKKEMAEKDERLTKAEKEREDRRVAAMTEKYKGEYTATLEEAFKLSGLPKNKRTINRLLDYIEQALDNDIDVTPSDIAKMARSDYEEEIKALFGNVEPDTLLGLLGEESVKKLRRADVNKLKGVKAPEGVDKEVSEAPKEEAKDKRKLTAREVFGLR